MAKAKEFFDKYAKEYEKQDRYRYLFYRWLVNNIIRQIGKEKSEIVDLGTGNGELGVRIAKKFPKSRITGADISKGMMKGAVWRARAAGIRNIKFRVSSIEKFRVKGADFVVSNLAFHHVKDKTAVITKMYQTLPKGGKLVIGDWFKASREYKEKVEKLRRKNPKKAREFDWSWAQALKGMSKEYQQKHPKEYPVCPLELKEIMKDAGFGKTRVLMSPLANFAIVVGEK